ncbi:phosphatidylinositol mannoside acyltransferase [Nakamurella antarctica]|uniref:Phosphatidylinositol mannoside acyltransferase n=1 Tax=Nakamurella antarctica TaxID=1902245 RepID=A0A3G8ZKI8_9ACTN|nr:phosphatidylinositol mannoside acyltransferase [Nakamurella antarctica]AZI57720.1 phosphatidylinositol mannoside acyltransferase [Nakamurella antarctica]
MSRAAEKLADLGYGAGWSLVKKMPEPLAKFTFDQAADLAFRRRGPNTVQFARNLHRVLGDQSTPESLAAVTHAGLRSYARYWRETFRLPAMDLTEVAQRGRDGYIGLHNITDGLASGRGVIVALPHCGNWDIAGLVMAQFYGGITTVAERLKPASLYDKFLAYRESLGFEVLPLTGGAVPPSQVLQERLKQGRMVCLLADRDLSSKGIPVTFFGEPTTMPAGPAMLAALTGADLLPANLFFTDNGWTTEIGAPIQVPGVRLRDQVHGGTQLLADFFASRIVEHPADWHMLQPLWAADRRPPKAGKAEATP